MFSKNKNKNAKLMMNKKNNLLHELIKGEVGAVKLVQALQLNVLLTVLRRYFFVDHLWFSVLCLLCLCARLFICAL